MRYNDCNHEIEAALAHLRTTLQQKDFTAGDGLAIQAWAAIGIISSLNLIYWQLCNLEPQ